jgi:hypothetical protein
MAPTTRQTPDKIMKHILTLAGLDQNEQECILSIIATPEDFLMIYNQNGINEVLADETKLSSLKQMKVK